MLEYRGYIGTVEPDQGTFLGVVAGPRAVITFEGRTFEEVERAFREDQKRQAARQLGRLLAEGLESGEAVPITPEDWRAMRREVARPGDEEAAASRQPRSGVTPLTRIEAEAILCTDCTGDSCDTRSETIGCHRAKNAKDA